MLVTPGSLATGRRLRPTVPPPARRTARGRRTPLVSRPRGRLPRPRGKTGGATGPSPVERRKPGSKHHLICDGKGAPLKVITTVANVNDNTRTLALVGGIPPVAGLPVRPRRRPDAVLGDKAYDSKAMRHELQRRRITPVVSRRGSPNIKGLGKLRHVVEQTKGVRGASRGGHRRRESRCVDPPRSAWHQHGPTRSLSSGPKRARPAALSGWNSQRQQEG